MTKASKLADNLRKQLDQLAEQITLVAESVADAALEQSDALDGLIADKARLEARRDVLNGLLADLATADQVALDDEERKSKQKAAEAALALLPLIARANGDIESSVNALIANIQQHLALADQFATASYDAGWKDADRWHLLDCRAIDAYIADALTRSQVSEKLQYIVVSGTQHLEKGTRLSDLIAKRNEMLTAKLKKVAGK